MTDTLIGLGIVAVMVLAAYAWQTRTERNDAYAALARMELLPDVESTFVRVHVEPLSAVVQTLRLISSLSSSDQPLDLHVDVSDLDDALGYLEERLRPTSTVTP